MSPRTELVLSWVVNLAIVLALPIRLGLAHASLPIFLLYAAVCGIILTIADDRRYLGAIFYRSDVRGYLAARIVIVTVLGIGPFLIAHMIV